jgi:hypothetical protein
VRFLPVLLIHSSTPPAHSAEPLVAQPDEQRVLLVGDAEQNGYQRYVQELEGVQLHVDAAEEAPHAPPPGVTALVLLRHDRAEIWAAADSSWKKKSEVALGPNPEVAALRVAEHVRAAWPQLAAEAPRTGGERRPPSAPDGRAREASAGTGEPQRARAPGDAGQAASPHTEEPSLRGVRLALGPSLTALQPSLVGAGLFASGGWHFAPPLSLELHSHIPLLAATRSEPEGELRIATWTVGLSVAWRLPVGDGGWLVPALGMAAQRVSATGAATAPYRGQSEELWSAMPQASLEGRWSVAEHWALYARVESGWRLRSLELLVADRSLGTLGAPWTALSLGVALGGAGR